MGGRPATSTSGNLWTAKTSVVLGCAWLYVSPFVSGNVKYVITGINAGGMTAIKLLPVGLVLVSVPFQQLSTLVADLRDVPWNHPRKPPENAGKERQGFMGDLAESCIARGMTTDHPHPRRKVPCA